MLEQTLNLEIEEAYSELKATLTQKACKIVSENQPTHLLVKQGSLWGMSPSSAKKTIDVGLTSAESGTQLTFSSRLSSDWMNLTVVGCALAVILVGVCSWMALDLNAAVASGKATFWSWLASANGVVDVSVARAFVNLTEYLAAFLSIIIILEVAIAVYAHRKIDGFAQGILCELSNNKEGTHRKDNSS